MWWPSGIRGYLVILPQPDAQWFESRCDQYFFLYIFFFPAN